MTDYVVIPASVFEQLVAVAEKSDDYDIHNAAASAKGHASLVRSMDSMPMDGTPVLFHTQMTVRYEPYRAKHKIIESMGRWQMISSHGQWAKLDQEPIGCWSNLPASL